MTEKKMYQNIVLELSDGRLISAAVPAFCHIGDRVLVRAIRVTNPERLPNGYTFEQLEKDLGCVGQKR